MRIESSGGAHRSPDKLKSRLQEQIFEQEGITPEFVEKRLEVLRAEADTTGEYWPYKEIGHEDAFYINSSDSLVGLKRHLDVNDQAILTVGGSGEFAQLFASKGAGQVDVFDMSWSACLINELKIAALRELSFSDYQKALGFCSKLASIKKESDLESLGDQDGHLLKQVAKKLTPVTKKFVDSFFEPKNKKIFSYKNGEASFVASRDIAYIGDVITTPHDFTTAQTAAKKCRGNIYRRSLEQLNSEMLRRYDRVYISNIGYKLEDTISCMKDLLKKGASSVVASWNNGLSYRVSNESNKNSIAREQFEPRFFTNQDGEVFTAEWADDFDASVPEGLVPVPEWFNIDGISQPLLPGVTFSLVVGGQEFFFILRSFPDQRDAQPHPNNPKHTLSLPNYSWIVEMTSKLNPSLR